MIPSKLLQFYLPSLYMAKVTHWETLNWNREFKWIFDSEFVLVALRLTPSIRLMLLKIFFQGSHFSEALRSSCLSIPVTTTPYNLSSRFASFEIAFIMPFKDFRNTNSQDLTSLCTLGTKYRGLDLGNINRVLLCWLPWDDLFVKLLCWFLGTSYLLKCYVILEASCAKPWPISLRKWSCDLLF